MQEYLISKEPIKEIKKIDKISELIEFLKYTEFLIDRFSQKGYLTCHPTDGHTVYAPYEKMKELGLESLIRGSRVPYSEFFFSSRDGINWNYVKDINYMCDEAAIGIPRLLLSWHFDKVILLALVEESAEKIREILNKRSSIIRIINKSIWRGDQSDANAWFASLELLAVELIRAKTDDDSFSILDDDILEESGFVFRVI